MDIQARELDDILLLVLSGRLDGDGPEKIRLELAGHLEHNSRIILDCAKLTFINSSGLGAIVSSLRIALNNDGDIFLANLGVNVQTMLELTRANRVFKIYPSVTEALYAFGEKE